MTTHHFGTNESAAAYIEDSLSPGNPPPRPTASGPLWVRDGTDHAALLTTTFAADTGYFEFTTEDVPYVEISTNNADPWHPLLSIESLVDAASAGLTAAAALAVATTAAAKAQQALDASAGSGPTFHTPDGTTVGPKQVFTTDELHLRSTDTPLSVEDFADLPQFVTTGKLADAEDYANANGVAPLGADGKVPASYMSGGAGGGGGDLVIEQNPDFTFPARTVVSTDPTELVTYDPRYRFTDRPPIGTDLATAYAMNPGAGIPGDEVKIYGTG